MEGRLRQQSCGIPRIAGLLTTQPLQVRQVALALLSPAFVAGLVLGADETEGPALAFRRHIDITPRGADRVFHMHPDPFPRPEHPGRAFGIGEVLAQSGAMGAGAAQNTGSGPVPWGFERFRDTGREVGGAGQAVVLPVPALPSTRLRRPRTKPPPRMSSNPVSPDEALSLPFKVLTPRPLANMTRH